MAATVAVTTVGEPSAFRSSSTEIGDCPLASVIGESGFVVGTCRGGLAVGAGAGVDAWPLTTAPEMTAPSKTARPLCVYLCMEIPPRRAVQGPCPARISFAPRSLHGCSRRPVPAPRRPAVGWRSKRGPGSPAPAPAVAQAFTTAASAHRLTTRQSRRPARAGAYNAPLHRCRYAGRSEERRVG